MDFKLTAEQLELQKVARDFAQKELTALADEMEESANPVPKDVLKKIGELGFLGTVSYTHLTLPTMIRV